MSSSSNRNIICPHTDVFSSGFLRFIGEFAIKARMGRKRHRAQARRRAGSRQKTASAGLLCEQHCPSHQRPILSFRHRASSMNTRSPAHAVAGAPKDGGSWFTAGWPIEVHTKKQRRPSPKARVAAVHTIFQHCISSMNARSPAHTVDDAPKGECNCVLSQSLYLE